MPGMKNQRLKYVQFDPNYRFSNSFIIFMCVEYFCFYSFLRKNVDFVNGKE